MTFLQQVGDYVGRLMSGGTLEIVLLIVLIIVALVILVLLGWVLWKLLVLAGKGLLWLFQFGSGKWNARKAAKRDEQLAAPPDVATGWSASGRIRLRRALSEAHDVAGADAERILVVSGEQTDGLFRSLGLVPPGVGKVGIAAGANVVLIDASKCDTAMLRRVCRALPWRRPIDALAAMVTSEGIPNETLQRATAAAQQMGMRLALHLVFPGVGGEARTIIDGHNGDSACGRLAIEAVRIWLAEGNREGLQELALAQSGDLPESINRALALAPSSIDIASLTLGSGLRHAVAQTTERTRPLETGGLITGMSMAALAVSLVATVLAVAVGVGRASTLDTAVDAAMREASSSWMVEDLDTVPSAGRVRRMAGLAVRLADSSGFSPLLPLAPLVPNASAPQRLGAAFLENYMLVPLADALHRQAEQRLAPHDGPRRWMDEAQTVSEWVAAWAALEDDPEEVDIRRLLAAAFGGRETAWAEGADLAMVRADAALPVVARGGLDRDRVEEMARDNFVLTMQEWAHSAFTNGPVASAARRAIDRSANWRQQHVALTDLRNALQDPAQQWLTAAEDEPDYAFELRILGRAVALPLLGQAVALEARTAVREIRLDARENVEYFILPQVGPIMVRTSSGSQDGGRGPSLSLSPGAQAWLSFLDRLANAGFADPPTVARHAMPFGAVTLDQAAVAVVRNKLRVFDAFAANLPADLPSAVAQTLIAEIASELVLDIAVDVERALRTQPRIGIAREQAQQSASVAPSFDDLREIEGWLRERAATGAANRVRAVRGRVEETILAAAAETLAEEDPLGVYPDPAADGNALVRRFERGLARLRRIHETFAEPFLQGGTASGTAAVEWHDMTEDIEGYERGDANAALSGLEGMVRAFAEDDAAACEAARPLVPAGRNDYLAVAASRFRAAVDHACLVRSRQVDVAAYGRLREHFERDVAWLWPYADDANAPEAPPSTMDAFVAALAAERESLPGVDAPLARHFEENARFWEPDADGGAVVRFRISWRSRPGEERFAEHLMAFDMTGVEEGEDGVHLWRYGAPFSLTLRLAKDSPYRFADAIDLEQKETVLGGSGNGGFLRVFRELSMGAVAFEQDLLDADGNRASLRVTARLSHADGSGVTMPTFRAASRALRN